MAKKETFMLVSLEEEKARKLAQVISNNTSRKILDYLAKKKATETELSKELGIPISTVHYNLKHLVENKLVESEEYHYSEKGREVLHYSLANKYVIIAPKRVDGSLKEKLKSIIPAVIGVGVIAAALQLGRLFLFGSAKAASPVMQAAQEDGIMAMAGESAAREASSSAAVTAAGAVPDLIGLWFAIGAVTFLIIYLAADYIIKGRKSR